MYDVADVAPLPIPRTTMFCFRAHRPTPVLLANYDKFVAAFGNDRVSLIVDQTVSVHEWPDHVNLIALDINFLDSMNLYHGFGRVGWRCGDYFYYLALKEFSFDYLWLIESDVFFDYDDLGQFFTPFDAVEADFISHRVRRREPEWYWHRSMAELGYSEVYGSLFPLTRISRPALTHLLTHRQRISERFISSSAEGLLFPNDEAFTASILENGQFSMQSLSDTHPDAFPFFQYADKYCLPDILAASASRKVIHSALEPEDYLQYAKNRFMKKLRADPSLAKTVKVLHKHTNKERHAEISASLLQTMEEFIDASL